MEDYTNLNLKQRLWRYANLITNNNYVIDEENKSKIQRIIEILEKGEKGIVICGKTGSGKTFIFQMLQKILYPPFDKRRIVIKHVNEVVAIYEKQGDEGLFKINNQNVCFDELGREKNGKFYGSECDVMQMLISHRYNLWKYENKLTFFTSNYSESDLLERYGSHSLSRLKEMNEFIILGGNVYTDRRVNASKLLNGFPEVLPVFNQREIDNRTPAEKLRQRQLNKTEGEKIIELLTAKLKNDERE